MATVEDRAVRLSEFNEFREGMGEFRKETNERLGHIEDDLALVKENVGKLFKALIDEPDSAKT